MVLELFNNPLDTHFKLSREANKATFLYEIVGVSNKQVDIKSAPCQRKLCWGLEQYQKYVEHVLETRHAGDFIFYRDNESHVVYVVDGQHRREAFVRFIGGEFKVLNNTIGWADFSKKEISTLKLTVTSTLTLLQGEGYPAQAIEEVYNRFNFSGVRHN